MQKKSLIVVSVVSILISILLVFWTVFSGVEKSYYLSSALIIVFSIIPFFVYFEGKKIKTSEIVVLSSMIAISIASRLAFSFVPQVKPMAEFVIVTAIAFGPNAGFVTGAVSIFVSNFFLGQGLFTPFQMLGMGLVGFLSALIFYKRKTSKNKLLVALIGGVLVFVVYGLIVDTCSVVMMATDYSLPSVIAIYTSGIPFNAIHAVTTAIVLYFINIPMQNKFERLRVKYEVFNK